MGTIPNIQRKNGRPKILTKKVIEDFERLLTGGAYVRTACEFLGVDYERFYSWYTKGKEYAEYDMVHPDDEIYVEFYTRISQATASAEVLASTAFMNAMKRDWRAAEAFLARRYPSRWGKKQVQVDLTVNNILDAIPDPILRSQVMEELEKKLFEDDTVLDEEN